MAAAGAFGPNVTVFATLGRTAVEQGWLTAAADPSRLQRQRAALLADVTGEPADRLLAWVVARTVGSAPWSAAENDVPATAADMVIAAALARLIA